MSGSPILSENRDATVVTTRIDNFAVTIDAATVVPVPAALPLLLTGLTVLGRWAGGAKLSSPKESRKVTAKP